MSSNDNMLFYDVANNSELKNKGFLFLDSMFRENGWMVIKNDINWICFTKPGFEIEYFEIKIDTSKISEIKKGVTTKDDIIKMFGTPQMTNIMSDSTYVITYQFEYRRCRRQAETGDGGQKHRQSLL